MAGQAITFSQTEYCTPYKGSGAATSCLLHMRLVDETRRRILPTPEGRTRHSQSHPELEIRRSNISHHV